MRKRVIAVAGPPGGGKTSLVRALVKRFPGSAVLHFDEYETATRLPVAEIMEWMKRGADFDDLVSPRLAEDLRRWKAGKRTVSSRSEPPVGSVDYLFLESPLGNAHGGSSPHIDLSIWIEIPFDLALARKMKEYTGSFLSERTIEARADGLAWLGNYLDNYLMGIHETLRIQRERVRTKADVVVDGTLGVGAMSDIAAREIVSRTA